MNLGNENEKVEFKKSTSELKQGIISLSAMLNKHGEGALYFGVKNDGTVIGQKDINENTMREISHKINEAIKPQIIPNISLEFIGDYFVIKVVAKGKDSPYSAYGKYYSRSFDEDKQLEANELKAIFNKDGEPDRTTYTLAGRQDLTFNMLRNLYISHGFKINPDQFEKNLGLLLDDGRYNRLAELLADENSVCLQVVTFATNDKTIILKRKEYGRRSLLFAMQDVLNYVEALNETKVKVGGITREEEDYFNGDAFKEAWLNAVVHNRWVNEAEPVVYIFDNRIEIVSDGGLPSALSKEDFFNGVSKPVNRRMLEIFRDLEFIEKTGHGVPEIVRAYGREAFKFGKETVIVTIPIDKELLEKRHLQNDASVPLLVDLLNENEQKILMLLRENPKITTQTLISETSLSERYINKILKKLKDDGYVERIGANKNGYWHVLK